MHPHIQHLIQCIHLEEKEQIERYRLDPTRTLRALKADGLALHPLTVTAKGFGYADYPELGFRLNYPCETASFRDGVAIECFKPGEDPVKGVLLNLEGKSGNIRLLAPDFPDWIEDKDIGIKLAPDTRTTSIMKKALTGLEKDTRLSALFQELQGAGVAPPLPSAPGINLSFYNPNLNESQQLAVQAVLDNQPFTVIHGPPGTGKTTTLIEAIQQLTARGERVIVSAPSNAAVDHICKGLLANNIRLLRVGNTEKTDKALFEHTPEGKWNDSKLVREIRQLKLRAESFRRMALKYKRNFDKAERAQRNLLFKEVQNIRAQIKQIRNYHEEKFLEQAQVIAGTPIGLHDAGLQKIECHHLILDEAGQCIEPLAWVLFSLAHRIVLTGDHLQLPPTVLSQAAVQKGFNRSILEIAVARGQAVRLLDTQYRMKPVIAGFSSAYFYNNRLRSATHLSQEAPHLSFIDTAGSGFYETRGPDGQSLQNKGELDIIAQLLATAEILPEQAAFISPYSGQVALAKEQLPALLRASTIDSFQGQEQEVVILSLVRSNEHGDIGFLKDYRRMNVAITRAQEHLIVIGDSATIGGDGFYRSFLEYVERHGNYRTVWEFSMD